MIPAQPAVLHKITARHLQRHAMLYVRQSTLHQVLLLKETAEILAPALGVPVLIDEGVQGLRLEACEGLTWDEIGAHFGHPERQNDPFRRFAPDADSHASFAVRTCEGLDRLSRHYEGKPMIIVGHSEIVEMTFRYFLGLPLFQQHLPINFGSHAPTAITHWRKGSKQWALVNFRSLERGSAWEAMRLV